MADVKSIIEIEIKDEQYRKFIDSFNEYNEHLIAQGAKWEDVAKSAGAGADNTKKLSDDAKAILGTLDSSVDQMIKFNRQSKTTVDQSGKTRKNHLDILNFSKETTALMSKWGSVGLAVGGALGTGFAVMAGVASSEANIRKETKTLGISAGELQSQETNFGKFIDVGSHLHAQNQFRNDVTKGGELSAAGLGGMRNLNNADFLAQSLLKVRETYMKHGANESAAQAFKLHEMGFSTDELQLLKNTSEAEIKAAVEKEKIDRKALDQTDLQLKSWQDLNIEINLFTKSLKVITADLLLPVAKLLNSTMDHPLDNFTSGMSKLIDHPVDFITGNSKAFDKTPKSSGASGSWGSPTSFSNQPNPGGRNNPGNLRAWGNLPKSGGFAIFPNKESGISALGKQLKLYQNRDHLNTITQIINKYAPSSENNTTAYIKDVSQRTGFNANEKLDLNNQEILSKLVAAITKHENNKTSYSPEQVSKVLNPQNQTITINNNTGGNATVALSSASH